MLKKAKHITIYFIIVILAIKKFCPICKSRHEKDNTHTQKIIDYDLKNYYCKEHNEQYDSYCNKCEKNIYIKCINKHTEHEIINYKNILPK